MEYILLAIAILLLAMMALLVVRSNKPSQAPSHDLDLDALKVENERLKNEKVALDKEKSVAEDRLANSIEVFREQKAALEAERSHVNELTGRLATKEAEVEALQGRFMQQKEELDQLQQKFQKDFENIATKVLKQNTQDFSVQQQKNLDLILKPFQEKIEGFEKKVQETYEKGLEDRSSLKKEVQMLHELNQQITKETQNLTSALKGDNKQQGNWGELVLEKVLERSGLVKGVEYNTQNASVNDEGKRIIPDVVVNLPDGKHLIIDSKVTLVDYEIYVNAEDEEVRANAMKRHILAIRTHIKGLAEKNYASSKDHNAPDLVLLFMPIESAFSLAIQHDPELFHFAYDRRIVLVTPTNLLATLRTVHYIWSQDKQVKNALEISEQAGKMLEQFVRFLGDLQNAEKLMERSQGAVADAIKRLATGNGNLIRQAEKIKKLSGKQTKKTEIPERFLSETTEDNSQNLLET